jgi:hypothetical protein
LLIDHFSQSTSVNIKPKISKMSLTAFIVIICGYLFLLLGLVMHKSLAMLTAVAPLIIIICTITSLILSIIDLCSKNRRKLLSIVNLSLCSLYIFVLIIGVLMVL